MQDYKTLKQNIQKYWEENKNTYLQELFDYLSFESISTQQEKKADIYKAAIFVGYMLYRRSFVDIEFIGKKSKIEFQKVISLLEIKLPPNKGLLQSYDLGIAKQIKELDNAQVLNAFEDIAENPVVVGKLSNGASNKNNDTTNDFMLVYGHYDVQPVNSKNWGDLNAFKPIIKDNSIFARGASDNKGRFYASLVGLDYLIQNKVKFQNIIAAVEGEEEIGGSTIKYAFEYLNKKYSINKVYINDSTWLTQDLPSVINSLRGAVAFDVNLETGIKDWHSGTLGNLALNAGQLASYVVFKLKDIYNNKIRIPSINKLIKKPSKKQINDLAKISPSYKQVAKDSGIFFVTKYKRKGREFLPLHLTGLRPSLDVHGIESGFNIPGKIKTIIPHKASIKFSIRTVPYLTSDKVIDLVTKYIHKILHKFKGIKYEIKPLIAFSYVWQDPNDKYVQKAKDLMTFFYDSPAYVVPNGASVPAASFAQDVFKNKAKNTSVSLIMPAIGLPSDNIHAPLENFKIKQIIAGAFIFAGIASCF